MRCRVFLVFQPSSNNSNLAVAHMGGPSMCPHLKDAHHRPVALVGGQEGVRAEGARQLSAQLSSIHRSCMTFLARLMFITLPSPLPAFWGILTYLQPVSTVTDGNHAHVNVALETQACRVGSGNTPEAPRAALRSSVVY